ncbi:MAG: gfo/Idh/MocA family oxidoreductase [Spirochaetaceae bacterium]|nr:MAG: gfo/Idh/MocA family oxidoreductase [Spirochaetaceae bacterium]
MSGRPHLRAGIVGSGFAAAFHYEALHRVYRVDVEITGVFSPNAEKRGAFANDRGITAFDSLAALIDASDVIHVCTPPSTHEEIAVTALAAGRSCIVEKPFTGFFGDGSKDFDGRTFDREAGLREAMASVQRMLEAERTSAGSILYAENWVYAPAIQKEREIIEKTGAQIVWMHGEESHSGSHSPYYGKWEHSGGGSIMGKAVHPLTAALYLKKVEGRARSGRPIRPVAVSARTHAVTTSDWFRDEGHLRTSYTDIEDYGAVHVVFEDGSFADIFASELVLGGVHNWIEVCTNNHRTVCNINPNSAMQTYNPKEENFRDIYVVEKTGTKQGWAFTSPDEEWFTGYQHEMNAFYSSVADGHEPESDSRLAADTIAVVYAAYLSAAQWGREVAVPQAGE